MNWNQVYCKFKTTQSECRGTSVFTSPTSVTRQYETRRLLVQTPRIQSLLIQSLLIQSLLIQSLRAPARTTCIAIYK
ncbi:MAG: hypothetical protein PHQ75_09215 [Thermoguttaceae bacterium]|nr:hypothetical protein [Thermoguttaceae bacterium]